MRLRHTILIVVLAAGVARADTIDRVVVFADRAEVSRTGSGRCDGGAAAIVFARLPDAVDPRTLRAEAADQQTIVVGVATSQTEQEESLDERVRVLQRDLQTTLDALARLERQDNDDEARSTTLSSYAPWWRTAVTEELRAVKPDVGRFEATLAMLTKDAEQQAEVVTKRQAERRGLERQRDRLSTKLARLNQSLTSVEANRTATVSVRCSGAAPQVRLAYVVPQAGWSPEYDLRFEGKAKVGAGTATLRVAASISQSSGEDWSDVEVWLSTAKPKLGGEAPVPNPIWVQGGPEEKQKTLVQAQEERPDDLGAGGGGGQGPKSAELDDGGKAFVLKLPRRVTVRADGRPYWFPVDDLSAKATASLVAVPALSPYVYQVAALKNPAAFPLVEGVVHVFRGQTFVGDAGLPYRAPGEPIELSLGLDAEVQLERTDLLDQHREAGFFDGDQTLGQAWRTTLKNGSTSEVTVELREQVPVSKMADIKVTVLPEAKADGEQLGTTAGFTLDDKRGHLRWQVTLKSGQKAKRDLAFTIALPKEWAVQ